MAVTIYDVAEKAKVSISTVSIVYNGGVNAERISLATRQRVEQAIRELGYEPNTFARNASLRKFDAIGVELEVGPGCFGRGFFYMQMLSGIESACSDRNMIYSMCRVSPDKPEAPKFLRTRCIDALIGVHGLGADSYMRAQQAGIPILMVNSSVWPSLPAVNIDEENITRLALDQLRALGHRQIAYSIHPDSKEHYSHNARINAYIEWCGRNGSGVHIFETPREKTWCDEDSAKVVDWAKSLLNKGEPVTAMIHCSGFSLRIIKAMVEAGIDVPGKLSVANLAVEPTDPPELGGVLVDPFEIGRAAGNELIDALTEKRSPRSRLVGGQWRPGASAGPAPAPG